MSQYKTVEDLPLVLTVEDVADITGICKTNAYALCKSKSFPCVTVGKRMLIPKLAFVKWMESPLKKGD
jgi:excisionase family DNA binding protein